MQYQRNYNFAAGQVIIADQIDLELDTLASVVNSGIDTANIVDGAITADKCATNINPETRAAEIFTNGVYSGLVLSPTSGWASLTATITAGTSYINGRRVSTSSQADHAFTASKDTYVDLDKNMNFTYPEVANGGAEPAVTANSLRIMKVVTDATKVTAYYDRRPWQWHTVGTNTSLFENSWVNYGDTFSSASFIKDRFGVVHMRGLVKSGTLGTTMFTLPSGFRPAKTDIYWQAGNTGAAYVSSRVDVATGGTVIPHATQAGNGWLSLKGIYFKAEA
jgi:hypothetical protein